MQSQGKKTLYVFSKNYPYSMYEAFVENEMQVMAGYFDHIRVFPKEALGDIRPMPANAVLAGDFTNNDLKGYKVTIGDTWLITRIMLDHLFDGKFFTKLKYIKKDLAFLFQKIREYKKLDAILSNSDLTSVYFYSVWMNDWTTVLAIARKRGRIANLYTRSHGYDMYDHRREEGYVPFRRFNLRYVNSVSCASKSGYDYLSMKYPALKHKFRCSVLGVFDKGDNPYRQSPLTIVTACNINEVKRVHLIAETLKHVSIPVKWILFGDGPLRKDIETLVRLLPPNIEVVLNGHIAPADLMAFYRSNPVNLFLLVSSTEGGVPVAIQEAVSFGIPVAATNVGGIGEIVSESTGFLLDENFDPKQLAGIINHFPGHPLNTPAARQKIKEVWRRNFDAQTNFGVFAKHILNDK